MFGYRRLTRQLTNLENKMSQELDDLKTGLAALQQAIADLAKNIAWLGSRASNAASANADAVEMEAIAADMLNLAKAAEALVVPGGP